MEEEEDGEELIGDGMERYLQSRLWLGGSAEGPWCLVASALGTHECLTNLVTLPPLNMAWLGCGGCSSATVKMYLAHFI